MLRRPLASMAYLDVLSSTFDLAADPLPTTINEANCDEARGDKASVDEVAPEYSMCTVIVQEGL